MNTIPGNVPIIPVEYEMKSFYNETLPGWLPVKPVMGEFIESASGNWYKIDKVSYRIGKKNNPVMVLHLH